jgi:hypothetical protein
MNLRILSNNEFLRYASNEIDDLTSSEIERELLRRMEATDTELFEAASEAEFTADQLTNLSQAMEGFTPEEVTELLGVMLENNIDVKPLVATLKVLDTAGITEVDELKEALEFAAKFQAIANDAGDVFTRLTTLISETQED